MTWCACAQVVSNRLLPPLANAQGLRLVLQDCVSNLAFGLPLRLDIVYSRLLHLMLRCASGAGSLPSTSRKKVFISKDCVKIIPIKISR